MCRSVLRIVCLVGAFLFGVFISWFAGLDQAPGAEPKKEAPVAESVDLFAAIQQGMVEVKLIAKDSTECNVRVKNKTDKPLSIRLPEAFAGVPVLAQLGLGGGGLGGGLGGGYGGGYGGGGYGGGGAQGFGGGFGGGGLGGYGGGGYGGGGFGGGMFNVPPEVVVQAKVPIVCLDHGKQDPNAHVQYEIRPLEDYAKKPDEVREVLKLMANGQIPQRVAQIAAWHYNNGMSFEELAAKTIRSAIGLRRPYFSPAEIQAALRVVSLTNQVVMNNRAKSKPAEVSPGETATSLNP
ncbi:hypothetical protein [Thermopirellula anaerolimosa]